MGNANIPVTDIFFDNMISIPFSLTIKEDKINYMLRSIKEAVTRLNS